MNKYNSLFKLDHIQQLPKYGIKEIIPNDIIEIKKSNRKGKKYVAIYNDGTKIHFGSNINNQYHDKLGHYKNLDHNDLVRRDKYLARASKILNKKKEYTANDPHSANYLSIRILW